MADSAPDPEVEDVLSSVRRLVSQELPRRSAQKAMLGDSGALVLTSNDRVEGDPKVRVEKRSLEQRIAELEAAVDDGLDEFEPDGSEDQSQHRPDRIVYTRPTGDEAGSNRTRSMLRLSEIALIETGPANEAVGGEDTPLEFRREAPMAEDVEPEEGSAVVRPFSHDPDDVIDRIERRMQEGPETADTAAVSKPSEPEVEDDFDEKLSAAVAASLAGDADKVDDRGARDADLLSEEDVNGVEIEPSIEFASDAKDATVKEVVADKPEVAVENVAATASEIPEAEVIEELSADELASKATSDANAEPVVDAKAALAAIPDEDAMRLLVGRLIREELRGELGESITRNVRKLVRREIMRVIESRDLD